MIMSTMRMKDDDHDEDDQDDDNDDDDDVDDDADNAEDVHDRARKGTRRTCHLHERSNEHTFFSRSNEYHS